MVKTGSFLVRIACNGLNIEDKQHLYEKEIIKQQFAGNTNIFIFQTNSLYSTILL